MTRRQWSFGLAVTFGQSLIVFVLAIKVGSAMPLLEAASTAATALIVLSLVHVCEWAVGLAEDAQVTVRDEWKRDA